ncbi:unnamed protein product [Malus baccata var. baccata]
MKKLLKFDFSAVVGGAVKDGATKIGAAEDEVSDERTVKCKSISSCALLRLGSHEPHGKIGMAGSYGARLV